MRTFAAFLIIVLAFHFTTADARDDAGVRPRVISLYAAHTEVLLRLGARDNIVGVSRQETYSGPETDGWSAPAFTVRDDVERFLAARPDIVLLRPQHAAGAGHLVAALERAGIRVIPLQVTRADELYEYWRTVAELVGREAECEDMVRRFRSEVDRYASASRDYPNKPGVFLEAIHREVKTFTPDSLPVWVVETAGGRNVPADAEPASPGVVIADYGPERLLAVAGQINLFLSQDGAMNRTGLDVLLGRPLYRTIPAFHSGRVYKIPEASLSRPTPSLLDGIRRVAELTGLAEHMSSRD
ncbi:MAG: ABC transporter substrate-binding protein [Planctomycetes bacterium]|nr:ABC transporter substrate-binding protein [Planctomycetota bacterium]